MNQRLVAACVALPLVLGLILFAGLTRLPYATFAPGGTLDVLGQDQNTSEIIQVDGHRTYRDDGQIRMTTVSVSRAQPKDSRGLSLSSLISTWFDRDDAVYPYSFVHPKNETEESSRKQGAQQMATSQEDAVEVALTEAGYVVPEVLKVAALTPGLPAEKVLQVGDQLVSINGTTIDYDADKPDDQLRQLITAAPQGKPLRIGIKRDGKASTVSLVPGESRGRQVIGITPGIDYDFPFQVEINISPDIGGPSAGLMFSLAVYDTLTPGSLTGGRSVAGTGEINPDGSVAPIGGIQQKIAGARGDGAQLFIVPKDNCADSLGADSGNMRLMKGTTMHQVRENLEKYAQNPNVALPTCAGASS